MAILSGWAAHGQMKKKKKRGTKGREREERKRGTDTWD
jgi:hypothetical protein